jgi:hypothetical protein
MRREHLSRPDRAFGSACLVNKRPMYQHIIGTQARFLISGSKAAQRILFHIRKA